MTDVSDHKERKPRTKKRGGLFVNDAELIELFNVPEKTAREAINELDRDPRRSKFPQPVPLWGNRRYWPAVKDWLDQQYRTGQPGAQLVTFRERKSA
jgi:hypothetical protein